MKNRIILVTGGARSDKSALAERLARYHSGGHKPIYIATAQPREHEMAARIAAHRAARGDDWDLCEVPGDLIGALRLSERSDGPARLIDCLTMWMSNALPGQPDIDALVQSLAQARAPVVLVSNELGFGIVPDNALARRFRDDHGLMNQRIAAVAGEVWLAVSGQALRVKPQQWEFP